MKLYYRNRQGEQKSIELTEKPLTIGRSADADVLILDEKASRVHCGIRYWDGDFYIKDLKSKNGTYVNDQKIDIHQLGPGDQIRIGSSIFVFEQEVPPGPDTALLNVQDQFDHGKGYSTILREIVNEAHPAGTSPEDGVREEAKQTANEPDPEPEPEEKTGEEGLPAPAAQAKPKRPVVRKRKLAGGEITPEDQPAEKKPVIKLKRPENDES